MKRFKTVMDASLSALVAVAAVLVIWRALAPGSRSQAPLRVQDAAGTIAANLVATSRGAGPLALVEFADFECPYCGRHASEVAPAIRKAFVDTGFVREVFINYPLANHPRARPASEAALCAAEQGKFWEMHDSLFLRQDELAEADFGRRARELSLDTDRFSRCLETGRAGPLLTRHESAARALGVRSTPSFFVGIVQADGSVDLKKRINGAVPFNDFRNAIMDVAPGELRRRLEAARGMDPAVDTARGSTPVSTAGVW
jgi:protein-disulfide isomerase